MAMTTKSSIRVKPRFPWQVVFVCFDSGAEIIFSLLSPERPVLTSVLAVYAPFAQILNHPRSQVNPFEFVVAGVLCRVLRRICCALERLHRAEVARKEEDKLE